MNLFELIPTNEKTMMEDYIDTYALPENYQREASLEKIMRYWNTHKDNYLYRMLGNKFIIEKPFSIREPFDSIRERMYDVLRRHDKFITKFINALHDSSKIRSTTPVYFLEQMTRVYVLAKNRLEDEFIIEAYNPDGECKKFSAQKNSKVVPLIGKIARWIGVDEGYEEFRIDHSMALNTAKLEGTLCLSIHPLDYMTMSDNESNWDSCMNWKGNGCFRAGTVEMMNSEMVVVGYFKSDNKTMTMPGGGEWNSKKWRELFIVNPELIMDIKSYPYESDELTLACLTWIRELVEKNIGWTNFHTEYGKWNPDYDDVWTFGGYNSVSFETGYMYPDINESYTRHFYYITCGDHNDDNLYCNYSGEFVCMCCGELGYLDDGDEGSLICEDCTPTKYYCDCCGEWEYSLEDLHRVGDCYYCDSCYEDLHDNPFYEEDGEEKLSSSASGLTIVNRNTGELYRLYVDYDRFYYDLDKYFSDFASVIHHFRTYYSKRNYGYSEGFVIYYEDLTERGRKIVEEYGELYTNTWISFLSEELTKALTTTNLTNKIIEINNNFNSVDKAERYARKYEYNNNTDETVHLDFVIKIDS